MITGATGKIAKMTKSLLHKKYRDSLNLFVVEGQRFVAEIPENVYIEFYACSDTFMEKNSNFGLREGVKTYMFSEKVFKAFSDTVSPQGIIAVCRKLRYDEKKILYGTGPGTYLVLEEVKDPGNLGTIIRTADASGIKAVLLTKNTADLYNPKVLRATMGSIFNVPVIQNLSLEEILVSFKSEGITIIGTSLSASMNYYDLVLDKRTAIIIGSEDRGISKKAEECCDRLIKIPMVGGAESLNAAVAASILMYEALRQRSAEQTDVFEKTNIQS